MGVNATVSLSLSELDGLRNEVKSSKKRVEELDTLYKEEIKKLESTQMQVKVTTVMRELYTEMEPYHTYRGGRGYPDMEYRAVSKVRENESFEYKNLDEIQAQLQIRAENVVADKIVSLEEESTRLRQENIQLQKAKINEASDMKQYHLTEMDKLVRKHKDEVVKLNDEIKTLKSQELEMTKDREIEFLKKQLKELSESKNKWFNKLF